MWCTVLAVSSALLPSVCVSCSRSLWMCCCRNPLGSVTGGLMMPRRACGGGDNVSGQVRFVQETGVQCRSRVNCQH